MYETAVLAGNIFLTGQAPIFDMSVIYGCLYYPSSTNCVYYLSSTDSPWTCSWTTESNVPVQRLVFPGPNSNWNHK